MLSAGCASNWHGCHCLLLPPHLKLTFVVAHGLDDHPLMRRSRQCTAEDGWRGMHDVVTFVLSGTVPYGV